MSAVLQVTGLCKYYPAFSLRDVSFSLKEGGVYGFIGRNGAGKTTTLKALLRFLRPDGGTVRFFGKTLDGNEAQVRAQVGYVPGGFRYYPQKKLKTITAVTRRFYPNWQEERYKRYLQTFSLAEEKTPAQLSEGMKVKYSLALALSRRARLLILDEPTSGLDPVSREDLLETLLALAKEEGVTILFSTHMTSDLDRYADHILYLREGRLIADSPIEDFVGQYQLAESQCPIPGGIGQRQNRKSYTALLPVGQSAPAEAVLSPANLEEIMIHLEKEVPCEISAE